MLKDSLYNYYTDKSDNGMALKYFVIIAEKKVLKIFIICLLSNAFVSTFDESSM